MDHDQDHGESNRSDRDDDIDGLLRPERAHDHRVAPRRGHERPADQAEALYRYVDEKIVNEPYVGSTGMSAPTTAALAPKRSRIDTAKSGALPSNCSASRTSRARSA